MRPIHWSLGLFLAAACHHPPTAAAEAPAPTVQADAVEFAPAAPQLTYLRSEPARECRMAAVGLTGRLGWNEDLTARVFPAVSGRIVEIAAQPGQCVAAGDVLARVRSQEFALAQAEVRKADAELQIAERTATRLRNLFEQGAAARKDADAADVERARALAERDRALATLMRFGGALRGSDPAPALDGVFDVRAPIAGIVVERNVNPGQEVRADQVGDRALFVISDPTRLWLEIDVPEAELTNLQPGQDVVVRARAMPDRDFAGRLVRIADGLDPATRRVAARCTVANPERVLRAGMYVRADVMSATVGVEVPVRALFTGRTGQHVFVATGTGRFERRAVQIRSQSGTRAVLAAGVANGEQVVTEGVLLLNAVLEGAGS